MSKDTDAILQDIRDRIERLEGLLEDYFTEVMPLLTKNEQLRVNIAKLGIQRRQFERDRRKRLGVNDE